MTDANIVPEEFKAILWTRIQISKIYAPSKILFDKNIVLDVMDRLTYADAAAELFSKVENETTMGYLCTTTITTAYDLAPKAIGAARAKEEIEKILRLFEVVPFGGLSGIEKTAIYNASSIGFLCSKAAMSRRIISNHFICFLSLMLVLAICPAMVFSEVQVISTLQEGNCSLTVEANDEWHTLRLRVQPEGRGCPIRKESIQSVLQAAFAVTGTPKLAGDYTSLSIGRLVDYPWLSQYLAATAYADAGWDRRKGKPVAMDINKYVSRLLSAKEIREQIDAALAGSGYRVVSTTVEKVLVGGFREVPRYEGKMAPGKVPYDAQVWFRLERP